MSKIDGVVRITKVEAAKLVKMTKQQFHYYDKKNRVPGREIICGHKVYDKDILKGWKPDDRRRKPKKEKANG